MRAVFNAEEVLMHKIAYLLSSLIIFSYLIVFNKVVIASEDVSKNTQIKNNKAKGKDKALNVSETDDSPFDKCMIGYKNWLQGGKTTCEELKEEKENFVPEYKPILSSVIEVTDEFINHAATILGNHQLQGEDNLQGSSPPKTNKKEIVLSIDGGGIRGLVPAILLDYIEKGLQESTKSYDLKLADIFNFMVGTSTGGIISLGLNVPEGPEEIGSKRPKYDASQFRHIYEEEGPRIFSKKMKHCGSFGNILRNKYGTAKLQEVLKSYFKKNTLEKSINPVLVTSYQIGAAENQPLYLTKEAYPNLLMREAALATASAPTYFKPASISLASGSSTECINAIDGGLMENNPALLAYNKVKMGGNQRPVMLVSFGTGAPDDKKIKAPKAGGLIGWGSKNLLSLLMNSKGESVDLQLKGLFKPPATELSDNNRQSNYYRIQTPLPNAYMEMDRVTKKNIAGLIHYTCEKITNSQAELGEIIDQLSVFYNNPDQESDNNNENKLEEKINEYTSKLNEKGKVKIIDFSNLRLQDTHLERLRPLLKNTPHLKTLNLSHNHLTFNCIYTLTEYLELKENITIELSSNNLRDSNVLKGELKGLLSYQGRKLILKSNYGITNEFKNELKKDYQGCITLDGDNLIPKISKKDKGNA